MFVFPTHAEGFGIVLIEAMAMGLPCLVSDIDVLKDVGGDSVMFYKVGDPADLRNKLDRLVVDKKLQDNLSRKGKKHVQKYSMDKFWSNYKRLYGRLVT